MGEGKQLNKYVIRRPLRSVGNYMKVFLASQPGLDREVELRLLVNPVERDAEALKRFNRECRALARLEHPNIARVLDVGTTATRIFYTTEHRNALSLEGLLDRIGGPMKRQEVTEVAQAIGSALAHVHERRLLHRNLSTESVFYDLDNQRPYLGEFSFVRDLESLSLPAGVAPQAATVLTPELFARQPYDHLTDLYMFGLVLWRLSTYAHPFPPPEQAAAMSPDALFDLRPPSAHNANMAKRLEALVMKLLARDRGARFQSADDFLHALGQNRRVMDAESLIFRERREILDGLRNQMKLKGQPEAPAPAAPAAPAAQPPSSSPSSPRPSAQTLVRELKSLVRFVGRRRDGAPAALFVLVMVAGAGILGLALWSASLVGGGSRVPRPRGAAAADAAPANVAALEDEVLRVAGNLQLSPCTEAGFMERWQALKAWTLALPRPVQAKAVPYTRLLDINLRFLREPADACRSLDEAFLTAERFIKAKDAQPPSNLERP